jgi:hypothetical protein
MFSTPILDVAAGVVFGFLAISLFTSAAVEACSSIFNLRTRSLTSGIGALVKDPEFKGLAKQLYEHALISPLGPGGSAPLARAPAYIDKMQFASALLDVTGLSAANPTAAAAAPGPQAVAALEAQVEVLKKQADAIADPQIKQLIQGIISRSAGNFEQIKTELAGWFDNGMDRLSGEYKRLTQVLTFFFALSIAFFVNLDTIRIGTRLWEQPALADKLKWPAQDSKVTDDIQSLTKANSELAALVEAGLPVGWAPGHFFQVEDEKGEWPWIWAASSSVWRRSLLGWLITAVAALFGAPFWFDALQSIVRLKGTGPSPDDKVTGRAAPK